MASLKSQQAMLCLVIAFFVVAFYWACHGLTKKYNFSFEHLRPVPKLVDKCTLRNNTNLTVTNIPIKIIDKYGILRNESQVKFEVCKTFKFSPVDWTLYELRSYDAELESVKCRELYKEIFREIELPFGKSKRRNKRVKWIIHPNSTITNLGCTRHTKMCEPGSFYDKKLKIRIDTPPCCREKLMKLLEIISTELNKNNVKYSVAGGLVIGYARNKEIIHYDEDVDMFIDKNYWRSKKFIEFFNRISSAHGFYQEWRTYDYGALALWYSKTNRNRIGTWHYSRKKKKPNMITVPNYAVPPYHYRIIEPPRLVSMNGIQTKMPNNILGYLDKTFGKGKWEHELLCKKKDERKCVG